MIGRHLAATYYHEAIRPNKEINNGYRGLKAAWDVAKALKIATDAIDDSHIKLQMAELISALANAKIEAAENTEKISGLQRQLSSKSSFFFDGKKYYKKTENGENEGPFCLTCYDLSSKEIRLQYTKGATFGDWHCRACNGSFQS